MEKQVKRGRKGERHRQTDRERNIYTMCVQSYHSLNRIKSIINIRNKEKCAELLYNTAYAL